ncbi:MAG: universal stress protein [Deltaproteobacteria bacterium]|nr:universal stress protein [Deltaproteobacteria bacterium]
MFKHILVPTDLTAKSEKAIEVAVKFATFDDLNKISLLHVIETIEDADDKEFREFYEKLKDRAEKEMNGIIDRYSRKHIVFDAKIVFGNRVREIVRFAHENAADLIILSSHKIEETDVAQGWATISYRVGILAHCPVMMVK